MNQFIKLMSIAHMQRIISVGISFPKNVLTKIDSERGDVPRSRYLLRVLENALRSEEKEKSKKNYDDKITAYSQDSLDRRFESLQSSEPRST
jgi:metal-responsive CopG/Arc/MetJ family transcriptional regulator